MKNKKGIALLMMLIMISSLVGVVMICAFVLSHEVNKDERYDITRQRMLEVKRSLIGRLADIGGGEDIASCGGFISDYGEPDVPATFNIGNLLSNLGFIGWSYNSTYEFWAGYRGERYIKPNANDESVVPPTPIFIDGWGNLMQVCFNGDLIEIESWGSDGIDDGAIPPTDYGRDIVDVFYWRRSLSVNALITTDEPLFQGRNVDIRAQLIYPEHGNIQPPADAVDTIAIDMAGDGVGAFTFAGVFPVGLRKVNFLIDEDIPPYMTGDILAVEALCISNGQTVGCTLDMNVEI